MVTKLFCRPQSRSFTFPSGINFFPKSSPPKPVLLCLISSSTAASTTTTTAPILTFTKTLETNLCYGPSLHQSAKPIKYQNHQSEPAILEEECVINEEAFTRVFNLTAIRVPSKDCFALENRLRGHLLNWPRIRNIARVPGDEVEDGLVKLLGERSNTSDGSDNEGDYASLNRRIHGKAEGDGELLSPVLYRDRLAQTFDSQGFVKFRNLAKLSRPKKKRSKEERGEGKKRTEKKDFAKVDVVEDEEGNDLRGLLGEEFKNKRWTGSTRLLLLDQRYGDKGLEELPDAIKAVLKEDTGQSMASTFKLVKCKLTLFYNYWQMDEILEALLPEGMVIPSAFETVGHIAHLNLRDEHLPYKKLIAKVILDKNKPKIQTVVNKIDAIHNDYRTMQLEVLAGNHSLVTTVIENGLRFHVDLATVYWNSRLATERLRLLSCFTPSDVVSMPSGVGTGYIASTTGLFSGLIKGLKVKIGLKNQNSRYWNSRLATERLRLLSCFTPSDVVCDVFSGVGPIAIAAAKKVKRVYANDLNPYAVEYLESNSVLNKLERRIKVFNMDGRRFINAMFTSDKAKSITQVVMNLPNDAAEFLDAFRGVFRDKSDDKHLKLPMIHVYGFSKAHDPEFDFHERIRIALSEVAVDIAMHKVRLVAPGKWMLRASFILPKSVAFAKTGRLDLD